MKLDELLPTYDVAARHDILVRVSSAETAAALELLLGLRTLGRRRPDSNAGTHVERLRRAGFMVAKSYFSNGVCASWRTAPSD